MYIGFLNMKIEIPMYGAFIIGLGIGIYAYYNNHFIANKYYGIGYSIGVHNTNCYHDVWGAGPHEQWVYTTRDNLVVINTPLEVLTIDSLIVRNRLDRRIRDASIRDFSSSSSDRRLEYQALIKDDIAILDSIGMYMDSLRRIERNIRY